MNSLGFWIRLVFFSCWLLAPLILALAAVIRTWQANSAIRGRWPLCIGIAAIANWAILFYCLVNFDDRQTDSAALFAYHLSMLLLPPLSFLAIVASFWMNANRMSLALANLTLSSLWLVFGYAPQHWLTRVAVVPVTIGDQQVSSVAFFGNPRQSEAEAVALVHVPRIGDFYFDFGQEKYRPASNWESVMLGYGAWSWGRMTNGQWREPLPTLHMNQTRLQLADGRVLVIPF